MMTRTKQQSNDSAAQAAMPAELIGILHRALRLYSRFTVPTFNNNLWRR